MTQLDVVIDNKFDIVISENVEKIMKNVFGVISVNDIFVEKSDELDDIFEKWFERLFNVESGENIYSLYRDDFDDVPANDIIYWTKFAIKYYREEQFGMELTEEHLFEKIIYAVAVYEKYDVLWGIFTREAENYFDKKQNEQKMALQTLLGIVPVFEPKKIRIKVKQTKNL